MRKQNTNEEHFLPNFSILFATCCTDLSVEDATQRMNSTQPTGIKSRWQLAKKADLPEYLKKNPWPCDDNPNWKHMYFVC